MSESRSLGASAGRRAGWSSIYQGDRPRDILDLTQDQEATIKQFIGFIGKDQDENEKKLIVLVSEETSQPTLVSYATTPIGTIILCPNIAGVFCYIHQAQSVSPVVGDWKSVSATNCT